MPLYMSDIRNCCTAKLLYGFGGSDTAAYGRDNNQNEAEMAADLEEKMRYCQRHGQGLAIVLITDKQVMARKVLEAMGWKLGNESAKRNHGESNLLLYSWACKDMEKMDVPVVNPFAPVKKEEPKVSVPVERVLPLTFEASLAPREFMSYVRHPVGRWIRVDRQHLGHVGLILREKRVSILTQLDMTRPDVSREIQSRLEMPQRGHRWSWAVDIQGQILYVYIHP